MEDNDHTPLQKRLSVDESNADDDSSENSNASSSHKKPLPVDKAYEGIRGHERHILFHFFTLFSISFFVGVVFIHLSLWMNSHLITASQPPTPAHIPQEIEHSNDIKENDFKSTTDDDSGPVWTILTTSFDYTGTYFHEKTWNMSRKILHTW